MSIPTLLSWHHKGGSGKTTFAINVATEAALMGKRVLLIDMDMQANASVSMIGLETHIEFCRRHQKTLSQQDAWAVSDIFENFHTIRQEAIRTLRYGWIFTTRNPVSDPEAPWEGTEQVIQEMEPSQWEALLKSPPPNVVGSINLLPVVHSPLVEANRNAGSNLNNLAEYISLLEGYFDLVVLDCPPQEINLHDAAFRAGTHLVASVDPEFHAIQGLPTVWSAISHFERRNGNVVEGLGVFVTKYDPNYGRHRHYVEEQLPNVVNAMRTKMYHPPIRRSTSVSRGPNSLTPIYFTKFTKGSFKANAHKVFSAVLQDMGVV